MKQLRNHLFLIACLGGMSMELHGMEQTLESIEQQIKSGIPSKESIETYKQITQIRNIIWKIAQEKHKAGGEKIGVRKGNNGLSLSFPSAPNPYCYIQTKQGYFLEYKHGHPCDLYTPWGAVGIIGGAGGWGVDVGNWSRGVHKDVCEQLSTEEYEPERFVEDCMSSHKVPVGPVYKVLKLDGGKLPDPIKQDDNAYLENHPTVEGLWNLTAKHLGDNEEWFLQNNCLEKKCTLEDTNHETIS